MSNKYNSCDRTTSVFIELRVIGRAIQFIKSTAGIGKIFMLSLFLAGFNVGFAQTELLLSKKSTPLQFDEQDNTNLAGTTSTTTIIIPSTGTSKYLGLSVNTMKIDISNDRNILNFLAMLIDMESGEIIRKLKNTNFYMEGDNIIKIQFDNFWDIPLTSSEMLKRKEKQKYTFVDPVSFNPISDLKIPKGEIYAGIDNGYYKTFELSGGNITMYLHKLIGNKLKRIGTFPFSGHISFDGTKISGQISKNGKNIIAIYDILSGQLLKEIPIDENVAGYSFIDSKNQLIYSYSHYDANTKSMLTGLRVIILDTGNEIVDYPNDGGHFIVNDESTKMVVLTERGLVKFLDMNTFTFEGEEKVFIVQKNITKVNASYPMKLGSDEFVIIEGSYWRHSLVKLQERLDQCMNPNIQKESGKVRGIGDIMYTVQFPLSDMIGSIFFTRANIHVAVSSVGREQVDVVPFARKLDRMFYKSPGKVDLEKGIASILEPRKISVKKEESTVVIKSLHDLSPSSGWMQVIASDGEFQKEGDTLSFTSRKSGDKKIKITQNNPGV